MIVNEIFRSIQGESTYSGKPCVFVRMTGCNLRCKWCDSKYTYKEGDNISWNKIKYNIINLLENGDILEFTGGEPLLYYKEINNIISELDDYYFHGPFLIETNGSIDINKIKRGWWIGGDIRIIMDWKCPSSGMNDQMLESNLRKLKKCDELKFVICNDKDYNEMVRVINNYKIKAEILMSTGWGVDKKKYVEKMLKDKLNIRFQTQLHKEIWGKDKKGV